MKDVLTRREKNDHLTDLAARSERLLSASRDLHRECDAQSRRLKMLRRQSHLIVSHCARLVGDGERRESV